MAVDEEFWRLPTVLGKTGMSRAQLYRRIDQGTFPPQRRYRGGGKGGRGRAVYWLASEVRDWQQQEVGIAC